MFLPLTQSGGKNILYLVHDCFRVDKPLSAIFHSADKVLFFYHVTAVLVCVNEFRFLVVMKEDNIKTPLFIVKNRKGGCQKLTLSMPREKGPPGFPGEPSFFRENV